MKEEAKKILKDVRVFVFGSVAKKKATPASDIDVLIVSENLPKDHDERSLIKCRIKSNIGAFSPFQIHLLTQDEYTQLGQKFMEKFEEI
jgi:hypothetical protein